MEPDNRQKIFYLVGHTLEEAKRGLIHDSYDSAENYVRYSSPDEEIFTVEATVHLHTAQPVF